MTFQTFISSDELGSSQRVPSLPVGLSRCELTSWILASVSASPGLVICMIGPFGLGLCGGNLGFFQGFTRHRPHFVPVLLMLGALLMVKGEVMRKFWLHLPLRETGASIDIYIYNITG